ncbi:hypothetical protein ACXR0O_24160 [Verrucomicrobiota bacterium sgz303538]
MVVSAESAALLDVLLRVEVEDPQPELVFDELEPHPELDLELFDELLDEKEGRDDLEDEDEEPPKLPPLPPRARRSCVGHESSRAIASMENRRCEKRNIGQRERG